MGRYGTYYSDIMNKPSSLYRLYDADGELLYVGISTSPHGRIGAHRRRPWGGQIDLMKVEWHPDRESAKAAERWAIHHECPTYNTVRPRLECC